MLSVECWHPCRCRCDESGVLDDCRCERLGQCIVIFCHWGDEELSFIAHDDCLLRLTMRSTTASFTMEYGRGLRVLSRRRAYH